MNANPPIQVAMAARRAKSVRQKVMQQMMQRSPGAASSASGGGGRPAFGSASAKLPSPHMTRASKLAPALIAALGIGGAGIPDNQIGGHADGIQGNIAEQAQGIPDWAPQPRAGAGGPQLLPDGSPDPTVGPSAPTSVQGGVTYAGYPSQGAQIPTSPDTSGMTPADAIAAQQAYASAMSSWNTAQAGGGGGLDPNMIHLGNGIFFNSSTGTLTGGGGKMTYA